MVNKPWIQLLQVCCKMHNPTRPKKTRIKTMYRKYAIRNFTFNIALKEGLQENKLTPAIQKRKKKFFHLTTHLEFSSCGNLFLYYSSSLFHESSLHHFLWNKELLMTLCLWSPLLPLTKLLIIQDHTQNLEEQLWMKKSEWGGECHISQICK